LYFVKRGTKGEREPSMKGEREPSTLFSRAFEFKEALVWSGHMIQN
jgi:hypothetical protein